VGEVARSEGVNRKGKRISREDMGEAADSEGVNRKGKRISREDMTDVRAGWASQTLLAYGRRHGQWAGWAERPGGPQGRPGRNQEKEFLN
jgi:hypothetical protein